MLKRKIYNDLLEWKNTPDHKPVIVFGCRQCGKTFSVLDFAQKNYKQVVYVNFIEHPELKAVFATAQSAQDIILGLSALSHLNEPSATSDTCLIFDEMQECPQARTALKLFSEEGQDDVIGISSSFRILNIEEEQQSNFGAPMPYPMVFEWHLRMCPLDFEEFMWANGYGDEVINTLKQCLNTKEPVPATLHQQMHELLLQYTVVGGMPEVVNEFISSKNIEKVAQKQIALLAIYRSEIVKYATSDDKGHVLDCFNAIPAQWNNGNLSLGYSEHDKSLLDLIREADVICYCFNLKTTMFLSIMSLVNMEQFKIYMVDIGLFVTMLGGDVQKEVLRDGLLTHNGAIIENLVADMLLKMNQELLYYHGGDGINLDFLIKYNCECMPLDIRADSASTEDINKVLANSEQYDLNYAIRLTADNISTENNILTLPYYMTFLLCEEPSSL